MTSVRRSIAYHRDFRLLWLGQSASYLGTQVGVLALPLTAAAMLDAGPFEMGVLAALNRLPYLVFGLLAGAASDRLPRRRLLRTVNLALAVTLALIPTAAAFDALTLPALYAIAALAGTLTVLFDITYLAFVPEVVDRNHLAEAQGLVEVTQSIGQLAGPALAGWLIAFTSPATAISLDAATYAFGALTVSLIASRPGQGDRREPARLIGGIKEGLEAVFANPLLRSVTLANATFVFWSSAASSLLVLFLLERLGAGPSQIGLIATAAGCGGLTGAASSGRIASVAGTGPTLAAALMVTGVGGALVPFAVVVDGSGALMVVATGQALTWFGLQVFNVQQVPFRYLLTPASVHGRVNATIRTVSWGAAPGGALLGGIGGEVLGLVGALALVGPAGATAAGWILLGPVRRVTSHADLDTGHQSPLSR